MGDVLPSATHSTGRAQACHHVQPMEVCAGVPQQRGPLAEQGGMLQGCSSIAAGSMKRPVVPVKCCSCISQSGSCRKSAVPRSSPIAPRVRNVTRGSGLNSQSESVLDPAHPCGSPAHPKLSWELSRGCHSLLGAHWLQGAEL